MADYRVVDTEQLDADLGTIADAIREQTGNAEQIPFPNGFASAPAELVELGKQAEYNRQWDALQENGSDSIDYRYKFFYWPNDAYKPKYPIRSTKANMSYIFQNSRIEDTIVEVDFSAATTCGYVFGYCSKMHTIRIVVSEKNTFNMAFQAMYALVNVFVSGKFGTSIDFQWSTLLSKASITSIVNALSSNVSGQSLTLSQTAVDNAFTADEWAALVATRPNWTFAYI